MSITAIQQSESLFGVTGARAQDRTRREQPATAANPNLGPDTVQFSEEALALLGRSKMAGNEDETEDETGLLPAEDDARETTSASLEDRKKSLFAIMLESLFLADLEENSQNSAEAAETGMPKKDANPLRDSDKTAEIKKTLNDVVSGKADIADLPRVMAMKSGSGAASQSNSPAAKKNAGSAVENRS